MNHLKPVAVFVISICMAAPGTAQIRIELRPKVALPAGEIRLGDIAAIHGNAGRSGFGLRKLDIAVLGADQDQLPIRRSRVAIRLQLAGWSLQDFEVDGADAVLVTRRDPEPLTDAVIEAAAAETMRRTFDVPSSELRVRLTSPFTTSLPGVLQEDENLRLEILPPLNSRLGAVSLTVRIWRDSRLLYTRSGRFEVLRLQKVAVTRTSMPRGHVIADRDFQFESRFLAAPADQLDQSQIVGGQVRTNMSAGAIISLRDLQASQRQRDQQIVKSRDNVQVTAIRGPLKVRLTSAEALQSGRRGDVIKVRNSKSSEVFTGRITAPGQVEVRL